MHMSSACKLAKVCIKYNLFDFVACDLGFLDIQFVAMLSSHSSTHSFSVHSFSFCFIFSCSLKKSDCVYTQHGFHFVIVAKYCLSAFRLDRDSNQRQLHRVRDCFLRNVRWCVFFLFVLILLFFLVPRLVG